MKKWQEPEMLDLNIALTAGGVKVGPNHSGHDLPTPVPTRIPTPEPDDSDPFYVL